MKTSKKLLRKEIKSERKLFVITLTMKKETFEKENNKRKMEKA